MICYLMESSAIMIIILNKVGIFVFHANAKVKMDIVKV